LARAGSWRRRRNRNIGAPFAKVGCIIIIIIVKYLGIVTHDNVGQAGCWAIIDTAATVIIIIIVTIGGCRAKEAVLRR
jgi:hypothetical protein